MRRLSWVEGPADVEEEPESASTFDRASVAMADAL